MDNNQKIVITGIGPISSVGIGRENFWQGILNKDINIEQEECLLNGELWDKFLLHKVRDFDINKFGIDKAQLNAIRDWKDGEEIVDLNYLIAAIKLALDDSGLDYEKEENGISLVLAHENLGVMPFSFKMSELAYNTVQKSSGKKISKVDFMNSIYKALLKDAYDVQTFADLFHVARVFNIHDYSLFINNACASGLYALESASQIIKSNQAKRVVVAASDHPDIYKYLWFRDLGIYAKDGIIKPFCNDSSGLVFGEGGVGIVMETLEGAQKRKATIYAEYLGGGFDLEGWKITVPQIGSKSYQKAMLKAFKQSNLKADEIDFICPHGVGSKPIDYYEAQAINEVFKDNITKTLITTFKPYVGHNLGGSALLETAILLLALKNNIVPATLNCNNIESKLNISLLRDNEKNNFSIAMKICCAFAGFNSAALFKNIKE